MGLGVVANNALFEAGIGETENDVIGSIFDCWLLHTTYGGTGNDAIHSI